MSVLPVGLAGGGGSTGYQISRSLRFRSSASAYLSRTAGSPTNQNKFTFAFWLKRGSLVAGIYQILSACNSASNDSYILLNNNTLVIGSYQGASTDYGIKTAADLRDPSAWYHCVCVYDSFNATATDRAIIYINGVRQTVVNNANGMFPANYTSMNVNANLQGLRIGLRTTFSDGPLDGYLSEVYFIDGQALTPSSFGETSATTGQWQAKKYTGTYGTNGFYLPFSDTTSTTTIVADSSGNGNNWTATNISLTAGATYDSMTDVPLGGGGSLGNGQGNYAVSNILDIDRANISTSNGNLTLTKATASDSPRAASSIGATTGKWYCEVTWASITDSAPNGDYILTGVTTKEAWTTASNGFNTVMYFAANAPGAGLAGYKQVITAGSAVNSAYGTNYFTDGSVIGIALDLVAGTVTFYNNNVSQGAITLPTTSEAWFPFCTSDGTSNGYTAHWNFGQRPFAYTPPTGFKALHTGNLSAPAIAKPSQHFDINLYAGTSATKSITGLAFQPDLVWIKSRGRALDHALYDRVRGVQNQLESNTFGAETTEATGLTAFNSDGWTMGALDQINSSTATNSYVGWAWKGGGAGVSNTNGTITSTVSVNTTAGISIVGYTGTGANATVGHGLGVAPKMVIVKNRTGASISWPVWHTGLTGGTYACYLNLTQAQVAAATTFTSSPTSTVINVGTAVESNGTTTMIAYCFAEVAGFSKIGTYVGNASADGPFVYCGFTPKYLMVRNPSGAFNFFIHDGARSPYNTTALNLYPNLTAVEDSGYEIDFLANGFKVRNSGTVLNDSAVTIIFAAFAEAPFQSALAR